MDDLTKRYAKALTAEVEAGRLVEEAKQRADAYEGRKMCGLVNNDPKLAQWKAQAEAQNAPWLHHLRYLELDARYNHAKAKARLAVIEDAVKRRRAREYGRDA